VEPEAPAGYVLATPLLIREDRARADLQRLGEGVFLLSAFSLGFLLIVSGGLSRYMARPLSALERGTRQIAAGRLSYRLPSPARRDEFGRLQGAFNAMAEQLDVGQRALEREKSRVQAILASVGAGVVALDEGGRIRLLNDRAASLLGQDPRDVIDHPVDELVDDDGEASSFWRAVELEFDRGGGDDHDLVIRRNGEERHYHMVGTALRDAVGRERGLVVAFEDITANVQSQRVLAWGEMARQVAHEIKNPLTPMKLSLQHLERTVEDRPDDFHQVFHSNLDLILAEVERLERIASNFARFAVPDPAVNEPFDAEVAAREVVALFEPGEDEVVYSLDVVGQPRHLRGDPEGFRRILVNLLQNSREAVLGSRSSTTASGSPPKASIGSSNRRSRPRRAARVSVSRSRAGSSRLGGGRSTTSARPTAGRRSTFGCPPFEPATTPRRPRSPPTVQPYSDPSVALGYRLCESTFHN
jgi:PAS domain S-box-containing protein